MKRESSKAMVEAVARDCLAVRLRLLNRVVTHLYDDALRPMGSAEALAALVSSSPAVNSDPYRLDALMKVLQQLLACVSAEVLTFRRDGSPWAILE